MEILSFLVDFILHVDQHLVSFIQNYGNWVYALLFLIIFTETGLVVMPFLPGDSLLFVTGALCGAGLMEYQIAVPLLVLAPLLGDQCNYSVGRYFGPKVFQWENSRFFNKKAFEDAHAFFEKHGGVSVILARFFPFLRTFVPFVAGVAQMTRSKYTLFSVIGALIWVVGLITLGYFLGNIPWVKQHLDKIIWAMILIPGGLVILGSLRKKKTEVS